MYQETTPKSPSLYYGSKTLKTESYEASSPVSPKVKWWENPNSNKNLPILKQGFKINLRQT